MSWALRFVKHGLPPNLQNIIKNDVRKVGQMLLTTRIPLPKPETSCHVVFVLFDGVPYFIELLHMRLLTSRYSWRTRHTS
jgi:hypothetical protein